MDFSCQDNKTIRLKSKDKIRQFHLNNILFIHGEGHISTVHVAEGKVMPEVFSILVGQLAQKLEPLGFFRINRNQIVNLRYCKEVLNGKSKSVVLKNDTKLEISRRRYTAFRKELNAPQSLVI